METMGYPTQAIMYSSNDEENKSRWMGILDIPATLFIDYNGGNKYQLKKWYLFFFEREVYIDLGLNHLSPSNSGKREVIHLDITNIGISSHPYFFLSTSLSPVTSIHSNWMDRSTSSLRNRRERENREQQPNEEEIEWFKKHGLELDAKIRQEEVIGQRWVDESNWDIQEVPDFKMLDVVLEGICPTIPYLKYKKLLSTVVYSTRKERREQDTRVVALYHIYEISYLDLYRFLRDNQLLSLDSNKC